MNAQINCVLIQEMFDIEHIAKETDVGSSTSIRHFVFQVEIIRAKEWTMTL